MTFTAFARLMSIVVFLALQMRPVQPNMNQPDVAPHGTEIVVVGYKDGFVVCADKRSRDAVRGYLDTDTKIIQLNSFAAFASAGTPMFFRGTDLTVRLFDADQITRDTLKEKSPEQFDDAVRELGSRLVADFKAYLLSRPYTAWPETQMLGNLPALFHTTVLYRKSATEIRFVTLFLLYEKRLLPFVDLMFVDNSDKRIHESGLNILLELMSGNINAFDVDRANPVVRRVFNDKNRREEVTLREALRFAREIIRIAHTKGNLIPGMENHSIGPTCDCALMTYSTGFVWERKNLDLLQSQNH